MVGPLAGSVAGRDARDESAHPLRIRPCQAQKVLEHRPEDADPDKVAAIEGTMFECLVYRAACLQATRTQPAAVEAMANLEKAVLLAKEPSKLCQVSPAPQPATISPSAPRAPGPAAHASGCLPRAGSGPAGHR